MKKVLKYISTLFICVVVGYLLVVLSYCLPVGRIEQNVLVTSATYVKETDFPDLIYGHDETKIGNHTDELMLLESIYDGKQNVFDKAIMCYRNEIPGNDYNYTLENLEEVFAGKEFTALRYYPRYWHGYLIILKPLLMFFNHNQIRYMNIILQMVLLVSVLFLMYKNNLKKYILPFLVSNLVLYPTVVALSMQYSIVYYILLIQLILLLKFDYFRKNFHFFMFLSGIATCYFDYFTWPLVTMGIPLLFKMILDKENLKENIKMVLLASVLWTVGYAGMWVMKFALGSLITGRDLFADGFNQMLYRSAGDGEGFDHAGMMESIKFNLNNMINNRVNYIIIAALLITIIISAIKNKWKVCKALVIDNIPMLLICLYPIIWFEVVANHSFSHYYMVYRILMITFFGVFAYILSIFETDNKE